MERIKRCPCCKGEPIYGSKAPSQHTIKCLDCGLQMTQDREDKVLGMWNERHFSISDVSQQSELFPLSFIKWYSGMQAEKIINAFNRWQRESGYSG